MGNAVNKTIKSSQEQAVAAWITYLNQCRFDVLVERIHQQDINLEEALKELVALKEFIGNQDHILGSTFTKHGEIAEHMQVNISNARNAIKGLDKEYTFEGVGRTAPEDYLKGLQQIQSKFYNGLTNTLFKGILKHKEKYPDFVANGGSYDIPKDQYEEMVRIYNGYKIRSSDLSKPDYLKAKKIEEFLNTTNLKLGKDIRPAVVDYSSVQTGVANKTVQVEENNIKEIDKEIRNDAYVNARPSLREGAKTVEISASIEGGLAFCLSIANKRKEKNFSEFTVEDWKEIGIDTGAGVMKGGVRGSVIYTLTNFTTTPANIASAYVTASFGVIVQIRSLYSGKISLEEFFINCETVCIDVSVSAISSLAGQTFIPIPVLGAVIGNVVGKFVYELCKKYVPKHFQPILTDYYSEMKMLEQSLEEKYRTVFEEINDNFNRFSDLEHLAFDKDANIALANSINLAMEIGVKEDLILHNVDEIRDFFLS